MSLLSHFTHWHTRSEPDGLAVSRKMPKEFLLFCGQEQTAQGSPSIFEPRINGRLRSVINALIKALISKVQLSANQV